MGFGGSAGVLHPGAWCMNIHGIMQWLIFEHAWNNAVLFSLGLAGNRSDVISDESIIPVLY